MFKVCNTVLFSLLIGVVVVFCGCGDSTSEEIGTTKLLDFEIEQDSEIESEITVDVLKTASAYTFSTPINRNSSARTPFQNPLAPTILEIQNLGPYPFKGLIMGVSRDELNATVLKKQKLRIKAVRQSVGNIPVFIGTAIGLSEVETDENSTANRSFKRVSWSFIAIPKNATLPGPAVGTIFKAYGQANVKGVCLDQKINGSFRLNNPQKKIKLTGILNAPLKSPMLCSNKKISTSAKITQDVKVIQTHIGAVFSGEGFLSTPSKGVNNIEIYTLAISNQMPSYTNIADTKPKSNVHFMDPEAFEEFLGFTKDHKAVFRSLKGNLIGLKVGDIIGSKSRPRTPDGFLRRVTNIETIQGKIVLTTVQARIDESFDDINIRVRKPYDLNDVKEGYEWYSEELNTSMLYSSKSRGLLDDFGVDIDQVIYDKDQDFSTRDDQIRVTGSVVFKPIIDAEIRCCSDLYIRAVFEGQETSHLKIRGRYAWNSTKTVNLPPRMILPPIQAGFITLVPKFRAFLTLDGTLSATITYEATQELSLKAGTEYENGQWTDLSGIEHSFESELPEFEGSLTAEAEAKVRGSLAAFGIAGIFAEFGGYARFKAVIPRDPIWRLKGGLRSSVGVDLDLLFTVIDYGVPLLDESWEIAVSENMPPDITLSEPSPRYTPRDVVVKGGEVTFQIQAEDPEGVDASLTVTLTSNLEGELDNFSIVPGSIHNSRYIFNTVGTHTITATSTDSDGNSANKTLLVVVDDVNIKTDPGVVVFDIPSTATANQATAMKVDITPSSNTKIDKIVWYQEGAGAPVEIRAILQDNKQTIKSWGIIGTTLKSNRPNNKTTWELEQIFEYKGATYEIAQEEIKTVIYYTKEGLPQQTQTDIHSIEVVITQEKKFYSGFVKKLSIDAPFSNRIEIDEEITIIPEFGSLTPDKCKLLSWSSSNLNDGYSDGVYFPSSTGAKTLSFSSAGERIITANMASSDCDGSGASITIIVQKPLGGAQNNFVVKF